MKINSEKTKLMLFNTSKKFDFMPEINLDNQSDNLELVESMKLLGITLTSDMKWQAHVTELSKKGMLKLWMLRRLKKIGTSQSTLLDLYKKQIRSLLEYAAPVWHPGLFDMDIQELERVQKTALAIIYGRQPYKSVLRNNKIKTLHERREDLCLKFAMKSAKHPQFTEWFNQKQNLVNTRSSRKFYDVPFKTLRWKNSPIPFMTNLLNS